MAKVDWESLDQNEEPITLFEPLSILFSIVPWQGAGWEVAQPKYDMGCQHHKLQLSLKYRSSVDTAFAFVSLREKIGQAHLL